MDIKPGPAKENLSMQGGKLGKKTEEFPSPKSQEKRRIQERPPAEEKQGVFTLS